MDYEWRGSMGTPTRVSGEYLGACHENSIAFELHFLDPS